MGLRLATGLLALMVIAGCTGGIHRDANCLASVTEEYLDADDHVRTSATSVSFADGSWREYQALRLWQEKIYQRLLTRLEERQILTETFFALLGAGPAIVLYPVVRWNVRSVLWDGKDPDTATDPITQYCNQRLTILR